MRPTPPTPGSPAIREGFQGYHIFSVDVEEFFQVNAFEGVVARERWDEYPSRVDASVDRLLQLLDVAGVSGTFFSLGWLAGKRPHLIREISGAGHEIASHGYWHRKVVKMSAEQFRSDIRESKAVLEDASDTEVVGFRAPSFSILNGMEWAFEVLLEEGYRYDSSRFPIRRPGYGSPGTPRVPHWIQAKAGKLLELPLATLEIGGLVLPAAGGGYLRQLPYGLIQKAFSEAEVSETPGMFYVHPWEIDGEQPRLPVSWLTGLRHYRGLHLTLPRIERLLSDFRFTSVKMLFPEVFEPSDPDHR